MMLLRARFHIAPSRRTQVVRSLVGVLGPTRATPGCISCEFCIDSEDSNSMTLIEEWSDEDSLRNHVSGESFKVLLSALDYADERPDILVGTLSEMAGLEFIAACRQSTHRD